MTQNRHSLKEWIEATRYWSFAVSAMPVAVCFSYLLSKGLVPAGSGAVINFILALAGAVILHAAGNTLSDRQDYLCGVDNKDAFAVGNLIFHRFEEREYLRLSIALFVTGAAIGIWLVFRADTMLLVTGILGIALTAAYSFLKYHALGDLDIFLIFAILIMAGTSQAVCGHFIPEVLLLAPPVGIITVSVLHANNTLDIDSDRAAGIRTFPMLIGVKASCRLYQAYMLFPFLWIAGCVIAGLLHPLCLISLAAAFPAIKNFKAAGEFRTKGKEALSGMDKASAGLQLVFSVLLCLGLVIATFL